MSAMNWILGAAVLALGAGAVVLHTQNGDLTERLASLEARLVGDGAAAGADGAGAAQLDARRERTKANAERIQALELDVARVAQAIEKLDRIDPEQIAAVVASGGGASVVDPKLLEQKIREGVMDMAGDVHFRTKLGLRGSPNLPKKPAFGQLAEALHLDANQEDRLRKDLMAFKEDFFAIISEERGDGIVPLEEIAKAEELGPNDPERAQIFIKLFTLKIPGSDETYMQRLGDMTTEFRKGVKDYLRDDQTEIFNAIEVDYLGVEMEG